MAKFCKYCGKQIEEGKICDCAESLKNAARLVNNIETINKESKEVFGVLKEYFKDIKGTVKKVIDEENKKFVYASCISFIIAIMFNLFTMFNRFSISINNFINSSTLRFGIKINELSLYNLVPNNGKMLLFGLVLGILITLVLALLVFILGITKKSTWSNRDIIYATLINTIPMSCVLVVTGIVQLFFSCKLIIFLHVIYLITFISIINLTYNIITDGFSKLTDIISYILLVFLGIIISASIYAKVFVDVAGSYKVSGTEISNYINMAKDGMDNLMDDLTEDIGVGMLKEIYDEIFESSLY